MIYDIVFDPNPILHKRSTDLTEADITTRDMKKFMKDMVETMYVKDGVGLAAVQVGKSLQLCTILKEYNTFTPREDLVLINPTWTKMSRATNIDEEGCLSLPGMYGKVKRYSHIKVTALDKDGKKIEFEAKDFFARIIQHEYDHLDGHLYAEKATGLHHLDKNII